MSALGKLINWLRNHPDYRDNTYIMITSDNGYQLGHHRQFGKQTAFLRNAHVPMLVLGPDLNAAAPTNVFTRSHLSAQIDIAPTCLELAGAAIPPQIDGKSFAPLLDRTNNADPNSWRGAGIVIEHWESQFVGRHDSDLNRQLRYDVECTYSALRVGNAIYTVWANGRTRILQRCQRSAPTIQQTSNMSLRLKG